jgi:hypothetical protein
MNLPNPAIAKHEIAVTLMLDQIKGVVTKPAWTKFVGIFEDDADFEAIVDELRAERESDDESEIDPAYYLVA